MCERKRKKGENMEIFTDASTRVINGRDFACAGAECPVYRARKYEVLPDATNNKGEITAIYLGIQLAHEIIMTNPSAKGEPIIIYSDSKISVFGLREWMPEWLRNRVGGVIMSSSMKPVKNQEVFMNIIAYIMKYDMRIILKHQKGHVNCLNEKQLTEARKVYYESNRESIDHATLSRICLYNEIVDQESRKTLMMVNPKDYPVETKHAQNLMAYYVPPESYREHIS